MSDEHPTAQVRPPGRFSSRGMGLFIALRPEDTAESTAEELQRAEQISRHGWDFTHEGMGEGTHRVDDIKSDLYCCSGEGKADCWAMRRLQYISEDAKPREGGSVSASRVVEQYVLACDSAINGKVVFPSYGKIGYNLSVPCASTVLVSPPASSWQ